MRSVKTAVIAALVLCAVGTGVLADGNRSVIVSDGADLVPSALHVEPNGDVWAGIPTPVEGHINEFRWVAANGTLTSPRFGCFDRYDPCDFAFRRDGDLLADGTVLPVIDGQNLGAVYAQPRVAGTNFPTCNPNAPVGGALGCRRSSQITFIAAGTPSLDSTPGRIGFYNTRPGQINGTLDLMLDAPAVDDETPLLITVRKNESEVIMQRVTIGPPDSGGPGFRALRVPN